MKILMLAGAAAAVLTSVAIAQAPATKAVAHSRADVAAKVQQHFTRIDADRNGAITKAEVQALQANRSERIAQRADRPARRDPSGMFALLDVNRDGQVTRAEFDARRAARAQAATPQRAHRGEQMFARLDSDRNGAISRAEFDAAHQLRAERMAQRAERMGKPGGRFGQHMFAMTDENKDGRVTLQEAQSAALRHFDMADTNKDGQVSREERRHMRKQMQGLGGHAGHRS